MGECVRNRSRAGGRAGGRTGGVVAGAGAMKRVTRFARHLSSSPKVELAAELSSAKCLRGKATVPPRPACPLLGAGPIASTSSGVNLAIVTSSTSDSPADRNDSGVAPASASWDVVVKGWPSASLVEVAGQEWPSASRVACHTPAPPSASQPTDEVRYRNPLLRELAVGVGLPQLFKRAPCLAQLVVVHSRLAHCGGEGLGGGVAWGGGGGAALRLAYR